MSSRDNFLPETKRQLAQRAGFRCSFPGCGAATIGPSEESQTAVSGTGMACHIASAAGGLGARRYDPTMSSAQRKSIDNGIWLCYTHGKLIDTDETRFTVSMLIKWKELSELRARVQQEQGVTTEIPLELFENIGFADQELKLNEQKSENHLIGNALLDSCVPLIWGQDVTHAIRDVVIELARNAFEHGHAKSFSMQISHKQIRLIDDGQEFDQWKLLRADRLSGGAIAIQHLVNDLDEPVVFAAERVSGKNLTTISLIKEPDDLYETTNCYIDVSWNDVKDGQIPITVQKSCKIIYALLPRFTTISDVIRLKMPDDETEKRPIVFIVQDSSPKVHEIIRKNFPESRIMSLSADQDI